MLESQVVCIFILTPLSSGFMLHSRVKEEQNMAPRKRIPDEMEGKAAPEFSLPDSEGNIKSLGDFAGRWLVLYFYPRDNTSGCTREAVGFTEKLNEFRQLGAEIVGVSKDSVRSHQRFIEKQSLGIILLSDEEHTVIEKYGAWKKKKLYGKEHWGTERSTFLIDPDGTVRKVWRKVKVNGHVEDVLETLRQLTSQE